LEVHAQKSTSTRLGEQDLECEKSMVTEYKYEEKGSENVEKGDF
jgi:hypothetical protein